MHDRPNWTEYFLGLADAAAKRSTCLRTLPDGIGCVLARRNVVVGMGYVGSIRGQPHCSDEGVGCLIDPDTGGCQRTLHAEMNAILHATGPLAGASSYTTWSPCCVCARLLVQAGVKRIVFRKLYRKVEPQRELVLQAGVEWVHVPSSAPSGVVEGSLSIQAIPVPEDRCGPDHGKLGA